MSGYLIICIKNTLGYNICFIFILFLFIIQTNRDTEALSRTNTQSLWDYGIPTLPPSEEVTRRTEQVTRRIQELWMAMQDPHQREAFVPCAERIRVAVAELTAIFPQVIKLCHIIKTNTFLLKNVSNSDITYY